MQIAAPAGLVEIHGQRQFEGCRCIEVAGFAPIEARMGDKNRYPAYGQCQETKKVDPVGDADQQRVSRHYFKSFRMTFPPFITNLTRWSSVMSARGSPETATRSAYLP